ncbi:Dabb family protein [Fulvivirga imtechensis]|uniref:Dabb family protein n=1 Tax=Fulvivirga imtechensis TaxID=881893 RepID=UPI00058BF473|nr:Dabb family protein [Fulvivirga imtechensis]
MKKYLSVIILAITCLIVHEATAQKIDNNDFVHMVFIWLKNPDNQEDRAKFEASLKKFIDSSKYVKTKYLGLPAATDRPVIDNTYTYCMILTFASKEEQDKYQAEEVHKTFIKESEHLWEKVLVYDSEGIW